MAQGNGLLLAGHKDTPGNGLSSTDLHSLQAYTDTMQPCSVCNGVHMHAFRKRLQMESMHRGTQTTTEEGSQEEKVKTAVQQAATRWREDCSHGRVRHIVPQIFLIVIYHPSPPPPPPGETSPTNISTKMQLSERLKKPVLAPPSQRTFSISSPNYQPDFSQGVSHAI